MDERGIERQLATLFGAAPIQPARARLRMAVAADRVRPPLGVERWRRDRRRPLRLGGALAGLAATIVVSVAVLLPAAGRGMPAVSGSATTPTAPPHLSAIAWRSGSMTAGPIYALNGRLWSFSDGVRVSRDGEEWEQLAPSSTLTTGPNERVQFTIAGEDGHGGIVAFGCSPMLVEGDGAVLGGRVGCATDSSHNTAWHSVDGRTWTHILFPGWVSGVAASRGTVVATSEDGSISGAGASGTIWHSTDGLHWSVSDTSRVPEPQPGDVVRAEPLDRFVAFSPTSWHGQFYAIALLGVRQSDGFGSIALQGWPPIVIGSSDGRSWSRAAVIHGGPFGLATPSLASLMDRLVLVSGNYAAPVSWASADGQTWNAAASPSPVPQPSATGDLVVRYYTRGAQPQLRTAVVRDSLVVMAPGETGGDAIWATRDGETWRSLGATPWSTDCANLTALGDHVVLSSCYGSEWWLGTAS